MSHRPPLAPLLQMAYQSADRAISDRLKERGFEVTRAHSSVLANIDIETGTRASVLAERAGITKQAVGQLVDDLEQKSYVKRVPDPDDGRARLVRLTAKGRRTIEAAWEVIHELEEKVLAEVGPRTLEAAAKTLSALVQVTKS